jgi:hypothetical protein
MKPLVWTPLLALTLVALAGSPAAADDSRTVRNLRGSWAIGDRTVRLDLPPGEIAVEQAKNGQVTVDLDVRCAIGHDCDEADRVELDTRSEASAFRIGVRGMPVVSARGISLRGTIYVPRGASVEIDMGAGELHVRGLDGDLDIDVGAGEVKVRMPEKSVRSVHLGVGIGDASLVVAGRDIDSRGWLGHRVRWGDGTGRARVNVTLGVGAADISLD